MIGQDTAREDIEAARVERIAADLMDMEREWLTGWQGVAGAAFNAIATGLVKRGLLKSSMDWTPTPLGLAVTAAIAQRPLR